jgi:hypothetical protein
MLGNFNFFKNNTSNVRPKYFIDLEKNPQFRKKPVKNVILFTNARDEKNINNTTEKNL